LVNDSIIVIDKETGKIVAANPKAYHIYGYTEPELIDMDIKELTIESSVQVRQIMDKVAASSKGCTFQTKHKKKNGTVMDVEINSQLFVSGNKEFFLNVIRDISMEKQFCRDLELARTMQKNLMPEESSPEPNFNFSFFYQPLLHVSGDMYDYVYLNDDCLVFLLVDVMGHGIPAALYTAAVKLFFRDKIRKCHFPSEFLSKLNRYFNHNVDELGIFMGAICLFLDVKNGIVLCSNGGINEFILFDSQQGKCQLIENKGPYIGMFGNSCYVDYGLKLNPGDQLYLYTDGLVDLRDVNDRMNPQELLCQLVVKNSKINADQLFAEYLNRLSSFADRREIIKDDVTLLKIEYNCV
jgi:sigma-B regulation protein RsbU (phosphoserine phosphatase)